MKRDLCDQKKVLIPKIFSRSLKSLISSSYLYEKGKIFIADRTVAKKLLFS